MHILYYVYTLQACDIEIGAWAYTSTRMNLSNSAIHMETAQFKVNGEWDIYATQARWKEVRIPSVSNIAYSKVRSDDVKKGTYV